MGDLLLDLGQERALAGQFGLGGGLVGHLLVEEVGDPLLLLLEQLVLALQDPFLTLGGGDPPLLLSLQRLEVEQGPVGLARRDGQVLEADPDVGEAV